MELLLDRKYKLPSYTIGKLYINEEYFCDTLEDTDRGLYDGMPLQYIKDYKIKGETAIPRGRYRITLKVYSPKFGAKSNYKFCNGYLPRLIDVPAYEGVLIHIGNIPKDTEGCILVGKNTLKGQVTNSTTTFKALYELLEIADKKGDDIWITIV